MSLQLITRIGGIEDAGEFLRRQRFRHKINQLHNGLPSACYWLSLRLSVNVTGRASFSSYLLIYLTDTCVRNNGLIFHRFSFYVTFIFNRFMSDLVNF